MKRILLSVIAAAVLTLSVNAQTAGTAVLLDIAGTVEIKNPGATAWTAARKGQELVKEAMISTGFKSTAIISIGNSTLTVRPLTRLSIEELTETAGAEQAALFLRTGRIRAEVTPPSGGTVNFNVRSSTATASVRGTVFEFDTENLRVENGRVLYSGSGGRVVAVGAGRNSRIDQGDGKPVSVFAAAEAEVIQPSPAGTGSGADIIITPPSIPSSFGNIAGEIIWE
jgi:hypothetical protein